MQLVILAGGKGTRLKDRLGDLPKPMVDVCGKPLLEHQILLAKAHGFEDILLLLAYAPEAVRSYFGDGARWGVRIRYAVERQPLGTAGAVLASLDRLDPAFVLMYGDTMLRVHLGRFWEAHRRGGAAATLLLHPNNHPQDSDLVETGEDGRITAFHPYPHDPGRYYPNLVNAALYVLDRGALARYHRRTDLPDFAKNLFPRMLEDGAPLQGYRSPEYIKDAGTPARLDQVVADYRSGRIALGSFATAAPAVFLDRDGVLNEEVNRVSKPEDLRLLPGAAGAIRRLNGSGVLAVVVTNQPVIARGDCTEAELRAIHNKLETLLGREGAYLDAIYYCPHHPDRGFPGERPALKRVCDCRKPAAGLILRAREDLNLDLSRCWMIGDSTVDLATAANAGIRSILVETGYAGRDGRYPAAPSAVARDLGAAVDLVLANSSERENNL